MQGIYIKVTWTIFEAGHNDDADDDDNDYYYGGKNIKCSNQNLFTMLNLIISLLLVSIPTVQLIYVLNSCLVEINH